MSMPISHKIKSFCDARRVRNIPKRALVADTLQKMNGGATAEQIWYQLHISGDRVSSTSVYIYLKWLTEKGFAEKYCDDVRETHYIINV